MLSLLCRVRTEPNDQYSPSQPTTADRLQIYACYQPHWNPKFNVPVLSIVACCNSTISPPMLTRSEPERYELTFQCSTDQEQGTVTFKLPLYAALDNIQHPITIRLGPHHPLPDSLTTYLVTTGDRNVQSWIKVWHLSTKGCHMLHNQGLYQPHRPYFEAEIHILGLSGKRKQPYAISQLNVANTASAILDPVDLGNVGYKKVLHATTKPTLANTGLFFTNPAPRAMPKVSYTSPWILTVNSSNAQNARN